MFLDFTSNCKLRYASGEGLLLFFQLPNIAAADEYNAIR
ncbi:hypothetical protein B4116_4049 [Bacillus cereus]|nr:hypothetical protein B4085_1509 [Bacillus cereus]KZD58799.1 hypothetical protein B4116_4049 [Bacillus cereus]